MGLFNERRCTDVASHCTVAVKIQIAERLSWSAKYGKPSYGLRKFVSYYNQTMPCNEKSTYKILLSLKPVRQDPSINCTRTLKPADGIQDAVKTWSPIDELFESNSLEVSPPDQRSLKSSLLICWRTPYCQLKARKHSTGLV